MRTMTSINDIRDRLADLDAEIAAINAEYEGRRFPDQVRDRWNGLNAERDELHTTLQELETRQERLRQMAANPYATERAGVPSVPLNAAGGTATRDRARQVIENAHRDRQFPLPDYAAERAEALVTTGPAPDQDMAARWAVAVGAPEYRSAFVKLLGDPARGHMLWTPQEAEAYRRVEALRGEMRTAMSLTPGNGGYMVPLTLDPAIMLTNAGSINPLRDVARVVQTVTNTWQGVTSAGATAEWKAEAVEAADGGPTIDDAPIPVHLGDVNVTYSYEVGMDAVDFLGELRRVMLDAAANLQAEAYTTGSGVGEPEGVVTGLIGTASELAGDGSEVIADSDPYKLQNDLGARFSANARFMSHLATANELRQMETSNGALLFPELRQTPPMLLGKPWHENSNMDGTINGQASESNHVLLYGDFAAGFVIVDRIGATLEILPAYGSSGRPTAQRHAFLTFRTGSAVVVPEALRLLTVETES
jgi:HK97 family phage major capsid protein